MHRDLIKNEWGAGVQKLMERMEPDDPRAEGPDRWRQALSGWATYVEITEPHSEEDCPFKDGESIKMLSVPS